MASQKVKNQQKVICDVYKLKRRTEKRRQADGKNGEIESGEI